MKTINIIWQGRGGQGIKTAAFVFTKAINKTNLFTQSFPDYGPERSGALVRAYTRISDREIKSHYPIKNPDILISTEVNNNLKSLNITAGEKLKKDRNFFLLPAKKIAQKFHSHHFNLPLVGALIALLEKNYSLNGNLILNLFKPSAKINPEIIKAGYKQLKLIL